MSDVGEINDPEVRAEVLAVFERYERALVGNDVDALDGLFWDSPHTLRYGFGETQHGWAEVSAFRRAAARQTPPRTLHDTVVTTYGRDVATVNTEFTPEGSSVVGRQSQTWVRVPEGWRVVSAHVSWRG
jgi:hypothetical protein